MTQIDELYAQLAAVGGSAWLDELLIRGSKDGIKGAHVTYGYEHPGIGGSVIRNTVGPWPVTVAAIDPLWTQATNSINVIAVEQLIVCTQALSDTQTELQAMKTDAEAAVVLKNSLEARIAELETRVIELEAALETIE